MRRWLFLGMVVLITALAGCNSKAEQARKAEIVRQQDLQTFEALYNRPSTSRIQFVHIVK
jgi:hypothetical protein